MDENLCYMFSIDMLLIVWLITS